MPFPDGNPSQLAATCFDVLNTILPVDGRKAATVGKSTVKPTVVALCIEKNQPPIAVILVDDPALAAATRAAWLDPRHHRHARGVKIVIAAAIVFKSRKIAGVAFSKIPSRKTFVDHRQIKNNCAPEPEGQPMQWCTKVETIAHASQFSALYSNKPLSITMRSRGTQRTRTLATPGRSCQISICSDSPGYTGLLKRTSKR
jgi:hypothetical protein